MLHDRYILIINACLISFSDMNTMKNQQTQENDNVRE